MHTHFLSMFKFTRGYIFKYANTRTRTPFDRFTTNTYPYTYTYIHISLVWLLQLRSILHSKQTKRKTNGWGLHVINAEVTRLNRNTMNIFCHPHNVHKETNWNERPSDVKLTIWMLRTEFLEMDITIQNRK